jgi:O-acetyl-ADP-ribose deacetylase (regulator of RNase III)
MKETSIIYKTNSDITTVNNGVIVHGVNCQGVMGSGVAKALKNKWPKIYIEYSKLFENNKPRPKLLGKSQLVQVNDNLKIFNAFTQNTYGRTGIHANPEAIKSSLENVIITLHMISDNHISHINIPKLGAGLGGLNWSKDVLPILEQLSNKHDIIFIVHSID